MAVTKTYVDAQVSGIFWHSIKPNHPMIGDCYYNSSVNKGYIWQGTTWMEFSGEINSEPPFQVPTAEQLETHPALKQAWEEFVVLKKLIGI